MTPLAQWVHGSSEYSIENSRLGLGLDKPYLCKGIVSDSGLCKCNWTQLIG